MIVVFFSEIIWRKKRQHKVSAGFTFIELLLIMAMVLILSVPTAIFSTRLIHQSAVRNASEAAKQMLGEAQAQALSGKNNTDWGVKHQSAKLILFSGDSFASRNEKFDRVFEIGSRINVFGFDEILFKTILGRPDQQNLNIRFSWGDIEESIHINSEGVIE